MLKEKIKKMVEYVVHKSAADTYKKVENKVDDYVKRYERFSFKSVKCTSFEQYEGVITRWYHTIEKGLSYMDFRPGFGRENINLLLQAMENYVKDGFDDQAFCFQTALSTLEAYIEKNRKYDVELNDLEKRIDTYSNNKHLRTGATEDLDVKYLSKVQSLNYKDFVYSRHSLRHFSSAPVDISSVENALNLAQQTPSACNRQGWKTIIIDNKELISNVLSNQNGNKGFGNEFDKLILIVSDIRYFNIDREVFQPYIDGGMYAQSVLNALHYYHIASVPLSASLSQEQEKNVKDLLKLTDVDVPIMFIGIGNYPDSCLTTKSERRKARIKVM